MAAKVSLRVRCDHGQGVVKGLNPEDSLEKFISHSRSVLSLEDGGELRLLSGFPPSPLDISDMDKSIHSLGVRSGDTIIFQQNNSAKASSTTTTTSTTSTTTSTSSTTSSASTTLSNSSFAFGPSEKQPPTSDSLAPFEKRQKTDSSSSSSSSSSHLRVERKVVPADNSCLFTSISYCMSGEVGQTGESSFMREIIASVVDGDKERYNEAFLGRSNESYCAWIQGKDAWGGAIEVQILAEYFQVEITVVDTVSGSLTMFGESQSFPSRMLLLYDGIHYDPLHLRTEDDKIKTIHSSNDDSPLPLVKAFSVEMKALHQYTDTAGFTLKCLVCGVRMKGESEAQKHAQSTQHTNFSEV